MDEQTSWKGHTFTLLIFGGIVVLCSIFFVLGMMVGRTQGQRLATAAASEAASKNAQKSTMKDERPEMAFYDSADKKQTPLDHPPSSAPLASRPAPAAEPPAPAPSSANVVNFQIGAFKDSATAVKLMADAKKKGFHAFMLTPGSGDPNPLYRVQVGPISDSIEQDSLKQKLVAAGFTAILKP